MPLSRRSFLRGGVSSTALLALPAQAGRPIPVPAAMYEPGANAMADTVISIVDMLQPSMPTVDFADLRAVLENGGRGAFGQGIGQR